MWITIYCDASLKDNKAHGGFWIRSNEQRVVMNTPLVSTDINEAEIEVAYYAIFHAIQCHREIEGILVRSDNMATIDCMKFGSKVSNNSGLRKYQLLIRELLASKSIKIRVKHIKGHGSTKTTPGWLNNQVDKLSKSNR